MDIHLPSAPRHVSDVEPAEPFDTGQRLTYPGYPPEAIAFLGISSLDGVGFQTMGRLGGRDVIRAILKSGDINLFERSIAEAGGRLADLPADWSALRGLIWQQGIDTASHLADTGIQLRSPPTSKRHFGAGRAR